MANLLSSSDRTALARERARRLAGSLLLLLGGVAALGTVLLVPSYIAIVSARETQQRRLETTRQLIARQEDAGASEGVESLNEKIDLIRMGAKGESPRDAFERIVSALPAGVKLTDISWMRDEETISFDIGGTAATRSSLIAFGDALRATGLFADVEIPLEALAPQTDLRFKLALILKTR